MTTCVCGQPTGDDGFICSSCADSYAVALDRVPGVAHELVITLSKQQRFSDAGMVAYRAHGFPYDVAASDALHALRNELVTLVRLCIEERVTSRSGAREPDDTLGSMSMWLSVRVSGVRARQWAPDALKLVRIIEHGESVIDHPVERTYAGPCDDCSRDLYVESGQLTVICEHCGRSYDLKARRDWLLHVVHDRLATAPEIARALSSLELPITHELIRQWRHRQRLTPRTHDRRGVPLYRVGDVVDLLNERRGAALDRHALKHRGVGT